MKKTCIIINAARGGIIHEEDLDKALNENLIFGAGLDVFKIEPPEENNPLLKNDKVFLSPHTAAFTEECMIRMGKETIQNIDALQKYNSALVRVRYLDSEIMKKGEIDIEYIDDNNKKTISVNTENFQTNKKGIFAVGDICTYPGKEKLILSGFHEAALASVECFKRARPNEKYRFEFTTSSKTIKDRLEALRGYL